MRNFNAIGDSTGPRKNNVIGIGVRAQAEGHVLLHVSALQDCLFNCPSWMQEMSEEGGFNYWNSHIKLK